MSGFVHLHVHSEYSLLDGAARIVHLAERAAQMNMPALALTDHGVMYGAIPFYQACRSANVKPIIGCEFYVAANGIALKGNRAENPIHHLTLLAKNELGYRHLLKLNSLAHLQGFHYKPRIDFQLLEQYADGLICLSGCLQGQLAQSVLRGREAEARELALQYQKLFGEDYYIELQDHQLLEQRRVNPRLIELARALGISPVATNDVHYIEQADAEVQDLLICIGTGKTVDDPDRMKMTSDQMYFKSAAEMRTLFPHVPEALSNTVEIAAKCELELSFGRTFLPKFPVAEQAADNQPSALLLRLCEQGLVARYEQSPQWSEPVFRQSLRERLEYELSVIQKMGFADYFLIVWDLLRYAHDQGIAVGPGRGSSAGSLVAYVLRITNVDPMKYRLLFERFLNPERISMPDIDMDLSDERRAEVIAYAVQTYGAERVAQIATFGTLASRMAVRDAGRVLNLPFYEVDNVAKLLGEHAGSTLAESLAASEALRSAVTKSPRLMKLMELAQKIEGLPRTLSTHAAGIVIAPDALDLHVPLQQGSQGTPLTQYSMEHVEAVGLVKIDFLGLRTLSVMERAIEYVGRDYGVTIQFSQMTDDDPRTFEMLARGETLGVFQLESAGMRRVLRELKPTQFEDLISVLALYRPGPMDFIPQFIRAKHGLASIEYPHPDLEPILRDTYGIIVYQEQIMQIANRMAGFSLGQADLLRRAVSKKKRDILDEQRQFFVAGSQKMGYSADDANKVYDMIVRFADYGFPRAHATAYAVLAFQTAWLKAHYPAAFMASMMTAVVHSQDKIAEYVEACKSMGIRVLAPDLNESGLLFTTSPQGTIRFGLAAIKNVGFKAVEVILQERQTGPFSNLVDFCRRIDLSVCNKRIIEALIMCGATDCFPQHRAQLLAVLDDVVDEAIKWKKNASRFELDLFGLTEDHSTDFDYPEIRPLAPRTQLEYEKQGMGVYLSGHPLDSFAGQIEQLRHTPLEQVFELNNGEKVLVAGIVLGIRTIVTKKGEPMAFVELENKVAKLELVVFPKVWQRVVSVVREGEVIAVWADVQRSEETCKMLAVELLGIHDAVNQRRWLRVQQSTTHPASESRNTRLMLKLSAQHVSDAGLRAIETLLLRSRGRTPVCLYNEVDRTLVELDSKFNVQPTSRLIAELEQLLGAGRVKLSRL